MIAEMVSFYLPAGTTRDEVLADARGVVDHWRANPDLVRKHFLMGEDGLCCGFYLWKSRAAAEAAHDEAWQKSVEERTASKPTFKYFDTLMVLDNEAGAVTEYP